jgi:hypothetical protein
MDGRATVWRRIPGTGELVREEQRFRPIFRSTTCTECNSI